MATLIADGPLGLEATHSWNADFDTNVHAEIPRVRWTSITGLHSLAEGDDNKQSKGSQVGEQSFPGMLRSKVVVYTGLIEANTLQDLRSTTTAMRNAFADRWTEKKMVITPHPTYGSVEFYYMGKCIALDIDDEPPPHLNRLPTKEAREVILSIRQFDPRYYHNVLQDSGAVASPIAVSNLGGAPTDPVIELILGGTATDVIVLTNDTTGKTLRLQGPDFHPFSAGTLSIDFRQRKILHLEGGVGPGVDVSGSVLHATSDWWDPGTDGLIPGGNQISFSNPQITSGRILHRHATY